MKNLLVKKCLLFSFLFSLFNAHAQDGAIHLNNPSFEDFPRPGWLPRGWNDCGKASFPKESPPDVHPASDIVFGVKNIAFDGLTYLGLVTREHNTWESVGQKLKHPLKKSQCYFFGIYLTRSPNYKSRVLGKKEKVEFTQPIQLRIWGANDECNKNELLAESELVENTVWKEYFFKFSPQKDYQYIILEAYFGSENSKPVNGNILLDNASPVVKVSCEKEIRPNMKWSARTILDSLRAEHQFKTLLERLGEGLKFKKNILTTRGTHYAKSIADIAKENPKFQLIINFNGLKDKRAVLRQQSIENLFLENGLRKEQFEFRNSKEEDSTVEWLMEKRRFYLGLRKKESMDEK